MNLCLCVFVDFHPCRFFSLLRTCVLDIVFGANCFQPILRCDSLWGSVRTGICTLPLLSISPLCSLGNLDLFCFVFSLPLFLCLCFLYLVTTGPVFTPSMIGHTSVNLALRKALDLYANIVPCFDLPVPADPKSPRARRSPLDLVVIRENTEGEYLRLEHEIVPGLVESLKVTTKRGSERIARYAFDYARSNGRRRVTAVHKANIMKLSDGLFMDSCRKIAKEYPDVEYNENIVDACCMNLSRDPSQFDVLVMPNLYGNIVTNVGAGLMGGPGLTPGANIGPESAVFEPGARHVALDIAGSDRANPTAILLSAVWMLRLMGLPTYAGAINDAVYKVLARPDCLTYDQGGSTGTSAFTSAVIAALGDVESE